MGKFILRRLLWMIPVLLAILAIMFLLMHSIPGNPWDSGGGQKAFYNIQMDDITRRALDQRFGLDQPLWQQFTSYLIGRYDLDGQFICGLVCGNLGPSYRQRGRSVQEILFSSRQDSNIFSSRFLYSFRLAGYAFIFALVAGILLGILSAFNQNRFLDYLIKILSTLGIAIPNFVMGLFLLMTVGLQLHWVSLIPESWLTASPVLWIIPVFVLGFGLLASITRITRASLLEVMRQDYVRTARAKGLGEQRIVLVHMLKNALIPLVTYSGPALIELIAGTFIIESMFGFPGMGREYVDSVLRKDYSMILGATIVYAALIAVVNLIVDVTYFWIDPRIQVEM